MLCNQLFNVAMYVLVTQNSKLTSEKPSLHNVFFVQNYQNNIIFEKLNNL